MHLKRPFAPLLVLVLAPQGFPILPAHLLAKQHDFNHVAFNAAPLGSGPYVVTGWVRGDRVEMRANPYYYRGKPKIERLQIRFVPDPNTAFNLLRTHEVDGYFSDQDYGNFPLLQRIAGLRVTKTPTNAVGAIVFNTRDPLTSDARVRRALALAIDIPSTMQKTYRGAVDTTAAGRGLFIWSYDRRAFPDIGYDPARARALLDAAGWKPGADGIRRKDGRALDVLFIIQAATPGDTIIGNDVTQYERAVGVNVRLKAYNITQFVAPVAGKVAPYTAEVQPGALPVRQRRRPRHDRPVPVARTFRRTATTNRASAIRASTRCSRGVSAPTTSRSARRSMPSYSEAVMLRRRSPCSPQRLRSSMRSTNRLSHQTTSLSPPGGTSGPGRCPRCPRRASRGLRARADFERNRGGRLR